MAMTSTPPVPSFAEVVLAMTPWVPSLGEVKMASRSWLPSFGQVPVTMGKWSWFPSFGEVALAVTVYVVVSLLRSQRARSKLPPGPPSLPVIGHLHLLGRRPHETLQVLAKKYGPLMHIKLGSLPTLIVSSPEMAKEVLKTQDKIFSSRPKTFASEHMITEGRAELLWSDVGPHWRHLRKIAQFELLSTSRVATYKDIRREEIIMTMKEIEDECKGGRSVQLSSKIQDFSMNNITRMMFGKKYFGANAEVSPTAEALVDIVQQAFELSVSFVPGEYIPLLKWVDFGGVKARMIEVSRRIRSFADSVLQEHRDRLKDQEGRAKEAPNFVDLLITLDEEDELTLDEIKSFFGDMLLPAIHTAKSQLDWTMAELMRNPNVRKKAQDELLSVVGPDKLVEESDIPNLPYLNAIVKESFRTHPLAPLLAPHMANESTEIAGYHIPSGTRVMVNVHAIHRDPEVWDQPEHFNPDRFISRKVDVKGSDFRLLPFGSGRRICPGLNLGMVMLQFPLAQLLHTFDWSLPAGQKPEDVDMTATFAVPQAPVRPLMVVGTPRQPFFRTLK